MEIGFKRKPDLEFCIYISILLIALYLGLFRVNMLCLTDYTKEVYTENGTLIIDEKDFRNEQCYPLMQYFKEVRERRERLTKENLELYTKSRYGDYNRSSLSLPSSESSS